MSYQEKKAIVSVITGTLLLGFYAAYTYGKIQSGANAADDLQFWAGTMLASIGIGIVVIIASQIIFNILFSVAVAAQVKTQNGRYDDKVIQRIVELENMSDEMNKRIELKSTRISYLIVGLGFVGALISLVLGYSSSIMLNIIFLSFFSAPLLQGTAQLYFYRKGVGNG
ncbi:hypothetical protein [Paenibacillus tarimensis]|uniref:hypothetical protein n=1 Tax=Paenibacillus tarimensis TaxID=416012 RepID=UPI001F2A089B|nr:hypothetical protein [Paenibacillus tarimensis]MCF2944470.1 hypothetical protein [Paenibacillus tarimensis]